MITDCQYGPLFFMLSPGYPGKILLSAGEGLGRFAVTAE